MGLISYIILVLVVGLIVWVVNTYAPIDARFKQLILVAAIVVLVLIFLSALLGLGSFDVAIPRLR